MRAYYDARAGEYDDWWLGRGLYAERDRPGWHEEVERLCEVVAGLEPRRVLDVASARLPDARLVQGDAVPLPFADGAFDRVFTGHFYGHLLPDERERFVAEARRVARELVVVDSALHDGVEPEERQERVLNDGTRHKVYKRYFRGTELADELGGGAVLHDGRWFVAVKT